MHDLRAIRHNPEAFDAGLARRGLSPASAEILALDARRRAAQTRFQELQQRRNELSRQVGQARSKGESAEDLIAQVGNLKQGVQETEEEERRLGAELDEILAGLPNLPADDVPAGRDERDNVELRRVGEPPQLGFAPRDHAELGGAAMDFERAGKLSGSRFVVLRRDLARLERALAQLMLDYHAAEYGYEEVSPPLLVRDEAMFGTGQLPKFAADLFRTTDGYWLIPTAEVVLTNLVAGDILDEEALPLRFTAYTPCFRSEAGAAGKDTRGMIRQHQFGKVELVSIAHPDDSAAEHERMTECAEAVLKRLELPFRTVLLCTGDMGFTARRTYDLEVWLPSQGSYREISSCSNCGDFQARRMNARFRNKEGKTEFVHTLNGSGLAVGRALVAVMENYQDEGGRIAVPAALQPYMGGLTHIGERM